MTRIYHLRRLFLLFMVVLLFHTSGIHSLLIVTQQNVVHHDEKYTSTKDASRSYQQPIRIIYMPHLEAMFGPPVDINLRGHITIFSPNSEQEVMCTSFSPTERYRNAIRDTIFLILRGNCSYDQQVNISQSLGAKAVIVGNSYPKGLSSSNVIRQTTAIALPTTKSTSTVSTKSAAPSSQNDENVVANPPLSVSVNNPAKLSVSINGDDGDDSTMNENDLDYADIDSVFEDPINFNPLDGLHRMYSVQDRDTPIKINIPSVFITNQDYFRLYRLAANDPTLNVTIGEESAPEEEESMRLLAIMLPFVAAGASVFFFIQSLLEYRAQLRAQAQSNPSSSTASSQTANPSSNSNGYSLVSLDEQHEAGNHNHMVLEEEEDEADDLEGIYDNQMFLPASTSLRDYLSEMSIHLVSYLSQPAAIFILNGIVYFAQMVISMYILIGYKDRVCSTNLHWLVSLFFCRAVIGFRICFWQTHSESPMPNFSEVFIKNCCDYVFICTGQVWNETVCTTTAPTFLLVIQLFVILLYITYSLRIILYLTIKSLTQRSEGSAQTSQSPSQLQAVCRALLSILNGGFYCAGALDAARPVTLLELRYLPIVIFRAPPTQTNERGETETRPDLQQDLTCPICMCEYEDGDQLRVLYCKHRFHQTCIDEWLFRNDSCPNCRRSVQRNSRNVNANFTNRGNNRSSRHPVPTSDQPSSIDPAHNIV